MRPPLSLDRILELREAARLLRVVGSLGATATPRDDDPMEEVDDDGAETDDAPVGDSSTSEDGPRSSKKRRRESDGGDENERPTKQRKRILDPEDEPPPELQLSVSLSESLPDSQALATNTVNGDEARPFTVLLWNVERYGSVKAEANPYANVLVRHVLDDLDVDLALFLETQGSPADVIAAVEHVKRNELATVRERRRQPGIDITDKKRFTADERRAFAEEMALRRDKSAFRNLVETLAEEGEVHFFPLTSGITGKAQQLPEKIATYMPRADRTPEVARFKKHYSYVGARLEPAWIDYLPDLTQLYDVRLRRDDAVPGSYALEDFTRPLTDAELDELARAVRALCFDERDIEALKQRRLDLSVDDEEAEGLEEYIAHILENIRDHVSPDGPELKFFERRRHERPEDKDVVRGQLNRWGRDMKDHLRDTRRERLRLLQRLEARILFTLRRHDACPGQAGSPETSSGPGPARSVIGLRNEGATCYVNAALQLLRCMRVDLLADDDELERRERDYGDSNVAADARLAGLARELLVELARQAREGTYVSLSAPLPDVQVGPEINFLAGTTVDVRRELLERGLIDHLRMSHEDAADVLRSLFSGFSRPGQVLASDGSGVRYPGLDLSSAVLARHYEDPRRVPGVDPQLGSDFEFVARVRKTYRRTDDVVLDDREHTLLLDDDMRRVEYDRRGIMVLDFPRLDPEDQRTPLVLEELLLYYAELDTSGVEGTESKCYRPALDGRDCFHACVVREDTVLVSAPPARLLVQLRRFERLPSGAMRKVDNPVVVRTRQRFDFFDAEYELHGFIEHRGETLDAGHNVAWVREGDVWHEVNDAVVTPNAGGFDAHRSAGYLFYFVRVNDRAVVAIDRRGRS